MDHFAAERHRGGIGRDPPVLRGAAVVLAVRIWARRLSSCRVVCLVETHTAEQIAAAGTSSAADLALLAGEFTRASEPRLLWVPSKFNRADGPSRPRAPATDVGQKGFVAHRHLSANLVEMGAMFGGRGVSPTQRLALDLEAVSPSVSRRFLTAALRAEGFPPGFGQVVEALSADNELLWQGPVARGP